MSVLLIDRKLLERLQERLDPHIDARDWGMVCDAFRAQAQAAPEAEPVEVVRADKAALDLLNTYIVTAEHPETGKIAICADIGTLRDCMEAALSAKP